MPGHGYFGIDFLAFMCLLVQFTSCCFWSINQILMLSLSTSTLNFIQKVEPAHWGKGRTGRFLFVKKINK